jgi:hypothetical protein
METYREGIKRIREEMETTSLEEFRARHAKENYDYTGFGYQLKEHYPKTRTEALEDRKTPELDELEMNYEFHTRDDLACIDDACKKFGIVNSRTV